MYPIMEQSGALQLLAGWNAKRHTPVPLVIDRTFWPIAAQVQVWEREIDADWCYSLTLRRHLNNPARWIVHGTASPVAGEGIPPTTENPARAYAAERGHITHVLDTVGDAVIALGANPRVHVAILEEFAMALLSWPGMVHESWRNKQAS